MNDTKDADVTLNQLGQQAQADIELVKQITAKVESKDVIGIVKILLENKSALEQQVKEVSQVAEEIGPTGWKEPALWVLLLFIGFYIFCVVSKIPLPPLGDDLTLGGLVGGYIAHRHQLTK
jgi:hypothetical protein